MSEDMEQVEEQVDEEEYVLSPEDQKEMGSLPEEAEPVQDEEPRIEVPAYIVPGTVLDGKTKEYRMPNNSFVKPITYQYKPMSDLQRTRYFERIRSNQNLRKVREVSYSVLMKHVVSVGIEGFNPQSVMSWSNIRPADIIEEIIDAITGTVKMSQEELKNLLTG